MENLKEKIETLLEKLEDSVIENPCNEMQEGFNFAIEIMISQLQIALGKTKTYTIKELIEKLKENTVS